MWLLDYMCKVNTSQNINHTIEYDFVCKTREHGLFRQKNIRTCFFIKTREHKNMFYLLRQENMREGEGLIEQNENMRLGWALPNTRCLRILT